MEDTQQMQCSCCDNNEKSCCGGGECSDCGDEMYEAETATDQAQSSEAIEDGE